MRTWAIHLTPSALVPSLVKLRSIIPIPGMSWRLTKITYVKSSIIEPFLRSFVLKSTYWAHFVVVAVLSFKDTAGKTDMGLAVTELQSNGEYQS